MCRLGSCRHSWRPTSRLQTSRAVKQSTWEDSPTGDSFHQRSGGLEARNQPPGFSFQRLATMQRRLAVSSERLDVGMSR